MDPNPSLPMARFLLVLKPRKPIESKDLIAGLDRLVDQLDAEVDHRTPAHLSAMLRGGLEHLRLQLFADVQAKAAGPVLELVLMSREPMGRGAPQTRECFEDLVRKASLNQWPTSNPSSAPIGTGPCPGRSERPFPPSAAPHAPRQQPGAWGPPA